MDLIQLFVYSFVVGFTGAMMPGPLLAVDLAETPGNGWKTGPIISTGHAIAEIVVVVLLAFGVAAISQGSLVTKVIGIVGGSALVLMAIMMGRDVLTGRVQYQGETASVSSKFMLIAKGITATLSNPYWFIWWATFGLALIVSSRSHGWVGPAVVYIGHILSDYVWYTAVSVLLWKGRKLIMGTGLKILLLSCALFMLFLGGLFIYKGFIGAI